MIWSVLSLLKRLAYLFPKRFRLQLGEWYFALMALPYRGNQVACPCCGGQFREFMARRSDKNSKVVCPRCLSFERHRLLSLYFKEKTNLFTDKLDVLHFAPEPCFYRIFKKLPNLRYTSTDLASPLADLQMDITDIRFPDSAFDVILCNHVLEHIPDDRKAMAELYRVLKPGGWAILQVPLNMEAETTYEDASITTPEERERVFGQHDHVRIYGCDYVQRLEAAGFHVKVDPYVRELSDSLVTKYVLDKNEDVFYCMKVR